MFHTTFVVNEALPSYNISSMPLHSCVCHIKNNIRTAGKHIVMLKIYRIKRSSNRYFHIYRLKEF